MKDPNGQDERKISLFGQIRLLWDRLTTPSHTIIDPVQKFKARLVVTAILVLFFLVLLSILAHSDLPPLILVFLIAGYLISRTKYYSIAAFLVIASLSIAVMVSMFGPEELDRLEVFLSIAWLTPSLIMSGLIFTIPEMLIIAVVHILFPLLIPFMVPGMDFRSIYVALGYLAVVSMLVLVTMRLRDLLEIERQKEITQKNVELETNVKARTAELESFSYSVSHDLRAPIRHISGFGQILLDEYADALDSEGEDFLRRILSSADHMDNLINDLLRLSKISQQELNVETIHLSEIVRNICDRIEKSNSGKEIEFIVADGIICQADENLISLAIENLLTNAVKYSNHHTHSVIEFGVLDDSSIRVYFVKDNGIGFDQKFSQKIFEPFQRLRTDGNVEGTGIGLTIVKRVIESHLGDIWVESKIDQGTTFYFTL
ncbi:MAG TPA: ATP-binding protein [Anaerolineales bacterium]|nr:ATP-binding protein [Anaerolineales bacterium]